MAILKYNDRVYGQIKIEEPIIIELIKTRALQRLKGVDQAGYFEPYFPGSRHSRFEHSLGDWWLLKIFGASLEEQIAGLIHDVSHSVFSHCIDYILDEGSEQNHTYQDDIFKQYISQTEIPIILKKYGFSPEYIIDESNFPLQEKELPDLCADRLDYSLRGLIIYKEVTVEDVKKILNNLIIIDNHWVFNNKETAEQYAWLFLILNRKYYSGIQTAVMFRTTADYLKYALTKKYISYPDLYTTDDYVLDKINKHLSQDKELVRLWQRMNKGNSYKNDKNNYEAHVFCKSRVVDPFIKQNHKIIRLSEIKPKWREIVKQEIKPKEYFLKFID